MPTYYRFEETTGGGDTALDSVGGDIIEPGDLATITLSNKNLYYFASSDGSTEDAPSIITPNTDAGTWCWKQSILKAGGIDSSGTVFINETTNSDMTIGLTINQSTQSGQIIGLKSGSVNHGFSVWSESDTYSYLAKNVDAAGGLIQVGISDNDTVALNLIGLVGSTGTITQEPISLDGAKLNSAVGTNTPVGDTEAIVRVLNSGTNKVHILGSGSIMIGDSANANQTIGITINQQANADEIITLKGSDIAHGITDVTETDTYGLVDRGGANGTLGIYGFSEGSVGMAIRSYATTVINTEAVGSQGCMQFQSYKKNGTGTTTFAADNNICVWRNATTTRMILKGDGELWTDLPVAEYDQYEDAVAVHDLNKYIGKNFNDFIKYNKGALIDMGVVSKNGFMSHQGWLALHTGAITEMYKVMNFLCGRLGLTYNDAKLLAEENSNAKTIV